MRLFLYCILGTVITCQGVPSLRAWFGPNMFTECTTSLTKAKVWERYGKVWAIYDPYVGMIWDSIDIMWDWYGV